MPLISQLLALLLLVVAIAMKMTVIQELVEDSASFPRTRNHCPAPDLGDTPDAGPDVVN